MRRIAAFLHSKESGQDELLPTDDVDWIDIDVAALVAGRSHLVISPTALCRFALRLASAAGAPVRRRIDELIARGGRLVVCADDSALALAVAYRYLWNRPIMPVRLVTDGLTPLRGRFGIWFHNRACYANIATSRSAMTTLRTHRDQGGRQRYQRLLSVVGPLSDDPEDARQTIRNAIDIVGQMPDGDEHIWLSYVTHFYCNQENPDSALELIRRYATYDSAVLDRVQFVIVDDGSPVQYEIPDLDLNLTWLKIDQDIPWNQPGARNLGVVYARADNVFLCDIDIDVPEQTLAYLARRGRCGKWMYRPAMRDETTGVKTSRHPNVFLLSRAQYFRFFGSDEDFSGHYSFDDLRFTKNQKLQGTFLWRLPAKWFIYNRSKIDRAKSYHSLYRDASWNALLNARKHFEYEWYGRHGGHSRKSLQFTWKVMAERRRKRPVPPINRLFKPTWYLRQIRPF